LLPHPLQINAFSTGTEHALSFQVLAPFVKYNYLPSF